MLRRPQRLHPHQRVRQLMLLQVTTALQRLQSLNAGPCALHIDSVLTVGTQGSK